MLERKLPELKKETAECMRRIGYSASRLIQADIAWRGLELYMSDMGAHAFTVDVADSYYAHIMAGREYADLTKQEKDRILLVGSLVEMMETGCVKYRRSRKFVALDGPIAEESAQMVSDLRRKGASSTTIDDYKVNLNRISQFMEANEITRIGLLTADDVIRFMETTCFSGNHSRERAATVLRKLLRKAYDMGRTPDDLSPRVPKAKKVRQPELPSVYSIEEVDRMLASVDRASAKGKRDFAILLLASRLGLRASDICAMTFSSIDWRSSTLRVVQVKTGEAVELPLLPEVGEAVIDYVRYARPESDLPYVFLHAVQPYDRLNRSTLSSIVTQYMREAGIPVDGTRKHGVHALRHSLAASLLEAKTPLPVISSVLGHASSESTRYYLRIDEVALRQCALEVPEVSHA